MLKRIGKVSVVVITAAALLGGGFWWGFSYGKKFPERIVVQGVSNIEPAASSSIDFGVFWQAWKLINDEYLKSKDVADQEKVYGAVRGLVESLGDPYSSFFSPKEFKKFEEDIQGSFSGIGAEIGIQKGQLVIVAPLKDTPASRAGLQAGDQILKINATSTDGLTVDTAVTYIRGPAGTEVVLTLLRKGWDKPKEFRIIRAPITVPTLDATLKEVGGKKIAYVQLYSFNANASFLFYGAMLKMLSQGAQGMAFDLRNDPGGYLEVAVDLAGWFVPRGTIVVSEEGRKGTMDELRASGNAALANFPVVVLINQGSASAAEILAGALRDIRRVQLVGEQSFGKGTVQQLENLSDGSSLKLTTAHWVLPSGQVLENGGLKPDVEVKMTDEDIKNNRDPQLEKALEIARSEIQ